MVLKEWYLRLISDCFMHSQYRSAHVHTHMYMYTHTQTSKHHKYTYVHTHGYIHMYMHIRIGIQVHTYVGMHVYAPRSTYIHADTWTHTTYIHSFRNTAWIHTIAHTHVHERAHTHTRTESWLRQKDCIFKSRYGWHVSIWASALQWIPRQLAWKPDGSRQKGTSPGLLHPALVSTLSFTWALWGSALGLSTYWSLCLLTRRSSRVLRQGCIFCSNLLCFVLISNLWQQHQEMKSQTQTY